MAYQPTKAPDIKDVDELRRYVEQELLSIQRSFGNFDILTLNPSYAVPLRPRPGMFVYADGTSWNPGAGQGVYVLNLSNAWVKL